MRKTVTDGADILAATFIPAIAPQYAGRPRRFHRSHYNLSHHASVISNSLMMAHGNGTVRSPFLSGLSRAGGSGFVDQTHRGQPTTTASTHFPPSSIQNLSGTRGCRCTGVWRFFMAVSCPKRRDHQSDCPAADIPHSSDASQDPSWHDLTLGTSTAK